MMSPRVTSLPKFKFGQIFWYKFVLIVNIKYFSQNDDMQIQDEVIYAYFWFIFNWIVSTKLKLGAIVDIRSSNFQELLKNKFNSLQLKDDRK